MFTADAWRNIHIKSCKLTGKLNQKLKHKAEVDNKNNDVRSQSKTGMINLK